MSKLKGRGRILTLYTDGILILIYSRTSKYTYLA